MRGRELLVSTVLLLAIPSALSAQEATPEDVFARSFGMTGLTPPDNLAASALGIGPDDVSAIRTGTALASNLLSGIGADGEIKGALGMSVSPFALGASVDEFQYRQNYWDRLLARSGASFALSQGETEGSDGSIAVGVRTVLFDRGDVLTRKLSDAGPNDSSAAKMCTTAAISRTSSQPATSNNDDLSIPEGPGESSGTVSPALMAAYLGCARKVEAAAWNDASLGVGVVMVSRAQDNSIFDISRSNTVGYVTATWGFEGVGESDELSLGDGGLTSKCDTGFHLSCNAQVVFHYKYQSDGAYELPVIGSATGESNAYGVKLVAGTPRSVGYVFYREEEVDFASIDDRQVVEYGIGFEAKVTSKMWLSITGGRRDDDILGEENTVKANLSWDLASAPAFLNRFGD